MERRTRISELTNRLMSNQFSEGGFVDERSRFGQSEDIQYQDDDDEDENEEYNSDSDQDVPKTRGISGITSNNTSRVLRNLRDGSKNLQTQREEYSKLKQRAIIPEVKDIQTVNRRKLNGSTSSVSSSLSLSESLRSISQYSDQVARAQEAKKFSFEQFLDKVGTENWYQIRSLACFCLKWFVVGWFIISQSFLFQKVKFLSYPGVGQIETLCDDKLIDQSEAENFLLPNQFYSISVEFNLFCENEYLRQILNFSQSVFGILGYCFFGYLSDNHGRKHGLKLAWKIFTIGLIIFCSTQVLPLVMAGYCISSFAALAVIIIEISLINEQSTGAVRVMSGIGLNIGFSFAQTIFTGFAYILHDWRILMFACGVIPAILLNLIFDNFEESPRYYYLKNKQKALRLLNRIALINGKRNLNIDLERSVWTEEWRDKSRRYKDLFQYLSLRICILAGSIIFFSTEMLFKAGEISLENNSLNTYQKVVLLSLSDVAASVTALFLINRMSRKRQLTISCTVSLVSIICFYGFTNIFNDQINEYTLMRIVQIAIAVVSRFSSNYLRTVAFVYFAELFPTIIRSMGMAVLFICSQLGSIIVYLMQLRNFSDALYIIPIIFCSAIAIVHIFWLPEIASAKQPICDEIAEIAFGYDDKFYLDETEDQ